jgi:hypothetical protein
VQRGSHGQGAVIGSASASSTGGRAAPATPAAAAARDAWWPRWRVPVLAWGASRVLVICLAILVKWWLGPTSLSNDRSVPGPLTLLGSWDTSWYIDIARHGYDHYTGLVGVVFTNLAFFPLLPAVMWLGIRTSTNPFMWGFVVSNLAFFGAVLGLHRLTWDRRGLAFANRATWVFALAPPAIYASLAYTDGILVALAIGAALAATRGRWYLAALAAALASLTRPQGIFIAVLVVMIALLETDTTWTLRVRHALVGFIPAVLILAGFLGWMQVARGSWQLPLNAQGAWHRGPLGVSFVTGLPQATWHVINYVIPPFQHGLFRHLVWTGSERDFLFTIVMVIVAVALWHQEGGWRSPWMLFTILALGVPLLSGSYSSMMRFGLVAFPLVWPVAAWLDKGSRRRVVWVLTTTVLLDVVLVMQLQVTSP